MGTDIYGWVEGRSRWIDEEEIWSALIHAGALLDRNYAAFARLFGVRNYENGAALAPHRGFPSIVSSTVQHEVEALAKYADERYLDGDLLCHSASWATWDELKSVDWSEFNESFQILRKLLEVLAQSSDFDEIRLVVWFDS